MTTERMIRAIRASNIKVDIQDSIVELIEGTRTTPAVSTGEDTIEEAVLNGYEEEQEALDE